jgi:hypothetical protein
MLQIGCTEVVEPACLSAEIYIIPIIVNVVQKTHL